MALALQNVDLHTGLHGAGGGKDLALTGGYHAVAGDKRGGYAAQCFNGQGQRGNIHQHQPLRRRAGGTGQLAAALQQRALHCSTHGHAFVRVQAVAGFPAQQLLYLPLHSRHPGAASHQQHLAQLAGSDACIPQRILHRGHGAGQQVAGHHLELRTGQRDIQMMRAILAHGDKGQVQLGRGRTGKLLFSLFRLFLEPPHGRGILCQVDAVRLAELCYRIFHDALVKIVTAQMSVAAGGQHGKGTVLDLDDGHVERAAAQVVDQDLLGSLVIQAIGHSRCRRLVDDAQHVQPRDAACILGGFALAVVKIGGHRDNGLGHRLAQIALGIPADLGQDHGADLLRGQVSAIDMRPVIRPHMPLDAGHGAPGVGGDLALGRTAYQPLAILCKSHHAGGGALALCIGDDHRLAALHHRHAGIGRAQINTDHFAHTVSSVFPRRVCGLFFLPFILPDGCVYFLVQL